MLKHRNNSLETMRKDGEELRLNEQTLKGDLREAEFEEKNINERLSMYDLEKEQFTEEQISLTKRKTEFEKLLDAFKEKIAALDQSNC